MQVYTTSVYESCRSCALLLFKGRSKKQNGLEVFCYCAVLYGYRVVYVEDFHALYRQHGNHCSCCDNYNLGFTCMILDAACGKAKNICVTNRIDYIAH